MKRLIEDLESRRLMATFTVTSIADSGPGSLRDAITRANATTAADVINFKIGAGGGASIGVFSKLQATQPVTIDATTQPGYAGKPLVRLYDGNGVGSGLTLGGAGSVVRGLSVTGFGDSLVVGDGTGIVVNAKSTIEKCYIGLKPDGVASANEGTGVAINASGTILRDNVISGNGLDGAYVQGDYVVFTGNIIGLDPTGFFARPNLRNGIRVQSGFDTQIGFDALTANIANKANVISANKQAGVLLADASGGARILNNFFGLSKSGNSVIANGNYGVNIDNASSVLVGNGNAFNRFGGNGIYLTGSNLSASIRYNTFGFGVKPIFNVGGSVAINVDNSSGNEITNNEVGNYTTGIRVIGSYNTVSFNHVGITAAKLAVPNVLGITVNGQNNTIEPNFVSNNFTYGVWAFGGDNNALRNLAWNNGQSVEVNAGVNGNLPKPVINSIKQNADGTYTANIGVTFAVAGTYRFAFYSSDAAGNAASGDTQRFLIANDRKMLVGGQGFSITFPKDVFDGHYLTVQTMKIRTGGYNGAAGEPSIAKKIVGTLVVFASSFDKFTQKVWNFTFSSDVSASLKAGDLSIRNTVTNALFQPSSVTWDASSKTARFTRTLALPAGKYVASIKTASVSGPGGSNVENFPLYFTVV